MTPQKRQRLLLGVLAVLLLALGWRSIGSLIGGGGDGGLTFGRRSSSSAGRGIGSVTVEHLDLESLQRASGTYTPGRDPFRFGPEERVVPPVSTEPRPRTPPPPPPRPTPASGPALPQVDFVYLGSFGPEARPIAVFSDQESIYNVQVGDVIKENFKLVQLGYESADLAYVEFPDAPAKRLEVGG